MEEFVARLAKVAEFIEGIVAEVTAKDGGTWCKAKSGYYVNKKYLKFVRYIT